MVRQHREPQVAITQYQNLLFQTNITIISYSNNYTTVYTKHFPSTGSIFVIHLSLNLRYSFFLTVRIPTNSVGFICKMCSKLVCIAVMSLDSHYLKYIILSHPCIYIVKAMFMLSAVSTAYFLQFQNTLLADTLYINQSRIYTGFRKVWN